MDSMNTLLLPNPIAFSSSSSFCSSKLFPPFTVKPTTSTSLSIRAIAQVSTITTTAKTTKRSKPISPTTKTNDNNKVTTPVPHKKVLVPIGFGTEEMEAVIIAAVLRAAGADVTVASVEETLEVRASGGIRLVADTSISNCADEVFDLVALPGGMPGSARLRDCEILRKITSRQADEKRLYGAICAAPAVTLQPWGLLRRKRTTCHPAFSDKLPTFWAVKSNIQVSGELTTSRGPGTSFEFALSLAEQLFGEAVTKEVRELLLIYDADDKSKKVEVNKVEWSVHHAPSVLVPVANGADEVEVVTIVDILRRAKVDVVVASIGKLAQITASRGTKIVADKLIGDAAEAVYDMIILPGGTAGVERLQKSRILKKLLKEQVSAGRIYGAVSSSPVVLSKQGLLKDKKVAAHPSVIGQLTTQVVQGTKIVIDGKVITSWGLAAVADFSLTIVSKLFGHARARSVAEGLVLEYPKS